MKLLTQEVFLTAFFLLTVLTSCGRLNEESELSDFETIDEIQLDHGFSIEPYFKWASKNISVSYVPDGTPWMDGQTSQCGTLLTANHTHISKAFETWAKYSKLSFRFVSDDGSPYGTSGKGQGDSRFGDIRIGCLDLPSPRIGQTSMCRGSGTGVRGTVCGDMALDIKAIPTSYIYSLVLHESGHALGLYHSNVAGSVMAPTLRRVTDAGSDDILAIQAQYGAPVSSTSGSAPTATPSPQPSATPTPSPSSTPRIFTWTPDAGASVQVFYIFREPAFSWEDVVYQKYFFDHTTSKVTLPSTFSLPKGKYLSAVLSYGAGTGSKWGSVTRFSIE